jgi:hypothetical protein
LVPGCTTTKRRLWSWYIPGFGQSATVSEVSKRANYLDATLVFEKGEPLRFLFPGHYTCTQVIQDERKVEFLSAPLASAVRGPEGRCDPVGILSLDVYARRHPRKIEPAERSRDVSFRVVYRDDDVAFVQGQYRFARPVAMANWRGSGLESDVSVGRTAEVLAIVPNAPECAEQLDAGKARAEFHEEGTPFRLIAGDQVCPVLGFARVYQPKPSLGGARTPR